MLTDSFWNIVHGCDGDPGMLRGRLSKLPDDELIAFAQQFQFAMIELNQWEIWGAGHVIEPYMSGDSFHYFRCWIIGKGKEAYETALSNPDDLGPFAEGELVDNELFEGEVIEEVLSRGLEDYRDELDDSDDTPRGEEWTVDNVHSKFPKLSEQFS